MTRLEVARAGTVLRAELHGPADGPLVVFSHGGLMDRRMFDAQVEPVTAASYRVLLWDLRGHGESLPRGIVRPSVADLAADLLAVMDATGHPEPAFLVGQSLGGMVAQHVALTAGDRVAGLVTIGAPCLNPDDRRLAARTEAMWRVSAFVNGLLPASLVLRGMVRWTAVVPEVRAYVRAATRDKSGEAIRWPMRAVVGAGPGLAGRTIQAPVLVVRGARDASGAGRLTAMTAPHWVRRDPDARYVELSDAGHQAHQDQPDAFNALLLEFLDAVGNGSASSPTGTGGVTP